MSNAPIVDKWKAFGWEVRVVDGHNYSELTQAMTEPSIEGQPIFIVANTVKGKGVSFMENVARWHHGVPSEMEYLRAIEELNAAEVVYRREALQ